MVEKIKKCSFCGEDKKLVDSHVIPKSIFSALAPDNDLKIIDNSGGFPKKSPQGVYDQIVCRECEIFFNDGDDYIKKFFDKNVFEVSICDGKNKGHVVRNCNIDKINQFIAGLLWRASVSSQEFYQNVKLGDRYENVLAQYIKGEIKFPYQVQYIFKKYDDAATILHPTKRRIDGLNGYDFHFGEWEIYIKLDQRIFSGALSEFADHTKEIWIMEVPYKDSNVYTASIKLAKMNKNFFNSKES